jgi:tetratricopeptide (TPR) repeat protein
LVDKSMVNADRAQGAETRYRLLETVRQYAREKLFDAGEIELLRSRHLEYYAVFAEEAYPHLHGTGRLEWTQRMKQEYDNIREALEWAFQDATRTHLGLGIVTKIADRFLDPMGQYRAGADWLKTGLIIAGESIPKLLKAQVYNSLCTLDKTIDPEHFQKIRGQCIQLCREIGTADHGELSLALGWHVASTSQEGVLVRVEEAIQIARGMGPPGRWALTGALAIKAFISTYDPKYVNENEAYAVALESVQLAQAGDRWHTFAYVPLGIVETRRGQFDQARQHLQKALDLNIEIEAKNGSFLSYVWLAWHYRQAGQADLAMHCCQDMYKLLDWLPWHTDVFFYTLGMVLLICQSNAPGSEDDPTGRDGLRLIALWDKFLYNRIIFMYDQDEYEQTLEQLNGQLGEAANQTVWAEGQAMTQDEGIAFAGSLLEKYAPKE